MITKAAKVGGWFAFFSSIASLFDLLFVKKYISHVPVFYAPYVYHWPRTLQLVLTLKKKALWVSSVGLYFHIWLLSIVNHKK